MTPPGEQLPPVAATPPAPPVDPRLTRLEQELQETRRLTEQISRQTQGGPRTPPPAPSAQPNRDELNREFYRDPVGMSQAIATEAARQMNQQFTAGHMDTLIASARSQVRGSGDDAALFDKYSNEIEARVALVDPQFRSNINVWQSAFQMVKGEHMRDIVDEARQARPATPAVHISREGGPAAPNGAQPPAPKATELSSEEKTMAKRLGITEDQYSRGKVDNDKQNDDFSPLGPSSWDKFVTFSSVDKRRAENARRRATPSK